MSDTPNVAVARAYLAALGRGEHGDALRQFFTDDCEQVEWPNALNPRGQTSNLASIIERSKLGVKLLSSQRYDVRSALGSGDLVAVEADWTGVLAVPVAGLAPGAEMRAHFAIFLEFNGGKIRRQRNYDCFDSWK